MSGSCDPFCDTLKTKSPGPKPTSRTFAIPRDHPIVKIWRSELRDPALKLLEDIDFLELGLWFRGPLRRMAKLTVLIVVAEKIRGDEKLAQARKNIGELCAPHGLAVAIIEGSFERGEDQPWFRFGPRKWAEKVPMGDSLGVEGARGGSLGGYPMLVDREDSSVKTPIFLTSRDVVEPICEASDSHNDQDDTLQDHGASPKQKGDKVQWPAIEDVKSEMSRMQEKKHGSRDFEAFKAHIKEDSQRDSDPWRTYQLELDQIEECKARRACLKSLKKSELTLGAIKMVSCHESPE